MRLRLTPWQRHAKWLRQFQLQARVVIVIGEIALAYSAFVGGMFVGLGVLSLW